MLDQQSSLPLSACQSQPEYTQVPTRVDKWDDYFMYLAQVVSIKSKDPRCAVGAVIVSQDNIVLSTGFNGLARGVHDDEKILQDADEKIKIICHAETNAILNAARVGGHPLQGATIFVTKFPCLACCNAIIQAGIRRLCTHDHEYWNEDPLDKVDHSRKRLVLRESHIEVYAPNHPDFKPGEAILALKRHPVPEMAPPKKTSAKESDVTTAEVG
jgi:dCMP deaminase